MCIVWSGVAIDPASVRGRVPGGACLRLGAPGLVGLATRLARFAAQGGGFLDAPRPGRRSGGVAFRAMSLADPLPNRRGARPQTIAPRPFAQVSQPSPAHIHTQVAARALELPGVHRADSLVSVPGAIASHEFPTGSDQA
jgi:hypothetical protein